MIFATSESPSGGDRPRPRRRWLTFSLRSFLVGSTLASLAIWGAVRWRYPPERVETPLPGGLVWREAVKPDPAAHTNDLAVMPHGDFALFDRHGRTLAIGNNAHSRPTGRWVHYHSGGRRAMSGRYVYGVPQGIWIAWDERGTRRLTVTYETGPERPPVFTPYMGTALPSANLGAYRIMTSSQRSGACRLWWPSGRLRAEGPMRDDLREGRWTFWNEAGYKAAEGDYHRGVMQGEWTLLDRSGDKPRIVCYWRGRELGERDALLARFRQELKSPDREARFEAVEALALLGPAAVPALEEALEIDDPPLVLLALRSLVAIGPQAGDILPAIEKLRASPAWEVRGEALVALFLLAEPRRGDLFRELLLLPDAADVAACTAWSERLAELGRAALPAIERALDDPDPIVRGRAVSVMLSLLADHYPPWYESHPPPPYAEVEALLEKAAQDTDPRVRQPAAGALARLRRTAADAN